MARNDDRAPILEMRGISKTFPGVKALNDVSLKAWGGEVLALMGENGAGKSTLIKALTGVNLRAPYFLAQAALPWLQAHQGLIDRLGCVMEIADVFCINKADHPRAKGAANEVRSILEIGQELDPDPWFPPIVMTRGDTGEGIEELKEAVQKHRSHLQESGKLRVRRRAALKQFVLQWATDRLEREMRGRLEHEDDELMEKVYDRELDPISASERIFKEV